MGQCRAQECPTDGRWKTRPRLLSDPALAPFRLEETGGCRTVSEPGLSGALDRLPTSLSTPRIVLESARFPPALNDVFDAHSEREFGRFRGRLRPAGQSTTPGRPS